MVDIENLFKIKDSFYRNHSNYFIEFSYNPADMIIKIFVKNTLNKRSTVINIPKYMFHNYELYIYIYGKLLEAHLIMEAVNNG